MNRMFFSFALCALSMAPFQAQAQSINNLRFGITPSTQGPRMRESFSAPRVPREVHDYRVAGAVFFGILGLGAVVIDRQARAETGGGSNNSVTDILTVAAFTGIGALLGSLIKKDP